MSRNSKRNRDRQRAGLRSMRFWTIDGVLRLGVAMLLVAMGVGEANAQFRVTKADGRTIDFQNLTLNADRDLIGSGQDGRASLPVPLNDVTQIEKLNTEVAATDGSAVTLLLNGGSQLVGRSIDFQDRSFLLMSESATETQVPMTLVQAIVFRNDPLADREMETRSTDRDTVVVQTPEGMKKVSGLFEGLRDSKVMLQFAGKSRTIGLEKVAAIVLADLQTASTGSDTEEATGPIAEVTLANGGRVIGTLESMADGKLDILLSPEAGSAVTLDFNAVRRIVFRSDRRQWLSSLEPLESEQQVTFAPARAWQRDRSVLGNPLRLRTDGSSGEVIVTITKGIGTQSFSRITFPIAERFDQFRCLAGIDVETRGRGDCVMKVMGDGIELWSRQMRGSDTAVPLSLDVKGMARLTLVVEPGEQFDLGDHADWADAQLLATQP